MNYALNRRISIFKFSLVFLFVLIVIQSCTNDANTIEVDNNGLSDKTTDLIITWNQLWLELDKNTNGMRPNSTARALAYIHLAAYETAVADMAGYVSNENKFEGLNISEDSRQDNINLNLALNTTYALVLDHFMFSVANNAKAGIDVLRSENTIALSQNLSQSEIQNSVQWGNHIAQRIIAFSQTDANAEAQQLNPNPPSYVALVGDGLWRAAEGESAWFPYWSNTRTFVIAPNETSSIPPPFAYSTNVSSNYYSEMQSVDTICTTARLEDNEDLWIAEFWSDDVEGLMMSPPGRQFSIANQIVIQENLDYKSTLELFLRLGFAINDAAVSAWEDKYIYNTQRPSTYIVEYINEDFQTNLARFISSPNPAFPSYPSGHATFAGASAGVFKSFFENDNMEFSDASHDFRLEFKGQERNYSSFSEMAAENAYSRVPLGVHVQADSDEGIRLGYEIADAVSNFDLNN